MRRLVALALLALAAGRSLAHELIQPLIRIERRVERRPQTLELRIHPRPAIRASPPELVSPLTPALMTLYAKWEESSFF